MANRFSLQAVFGASDRFSATVSKMENRISAMTKRVRGGLGAVDRFNERVSGGLQQVAITGGAAGLAMGFAAHNVVSAGADFEQAIADVGAVSLMTRGEVADLEKQALDLGASTKFSAKEVAAGMELMGRAGFTNAEIMQAIPGVLNAAAAEGAELAEVAGIVSNVLKGMGLEASQTTRVADVLALASARTNSSITSLGESMANASATARQFKIPFEDTVSAVALLQDVGMDASEAGTAINTMLTKLAKPSKEAAAEMAALGIKFQDAAGNMLPLPQLLGQFEKGAKKAGGNMKQVAFFAELVGLRGQKAALNLMDLFKSGKVGDLTKELQNAQGSAEKMAKLRMDTFKGDVSKLEKAFDAVKISLFDMNSKGMRGVVQSTTAWVLANKELIKTRVQDFIVGIVTHLPEIYLWAKRIAFGVLVFYAWAIAVKAAGFATFLFEGAVTAAGIAASALGVVMGILAAVTDTATIATVLHTAWTWLKNAAMIAYNAVVWLGVAAMTAYAIVTSDATVRNVLAEAIMAVLRAGFIAYNAVVGIATALIAAYNAGTLLTTIQQGALVAVIWLAVAAQTALNAVMSVNPAFLVGAAIIGLIALVLKLSGGWDFLKEKISGFASSAMARIQPIVDKVMAFYNAVKKAAGAVGQFLGFGEGTPGGAPPGFVRAPDADSQLPLMTPSDGVSKTVEESNFVSRADLLIHDPTGRAELVNKDLGPGMAIRLAPSGQFAPGP